MHNHYGFKANLIAGWMLKNSNKPQKPPKPGLCVQTLQFMSASQQNSGVDLEAQRWSQLPAAPLIITHLDLHNTHTHMQMLMPVSVWPAVLCNRIENTLTERVNLKKSMCNALPMKHPLITSINRLLKTEEKTFIGLYGWQTEAITAESGGGEGWDERRWWEGR